MPSLFPVEEITPLLYELLYSPIGLDLKLANRAPKTAQSWDSPGAIFVGLGDQTQRTGALLRARFTSFRSSPIGLYSKRVHTVRG